MADASRFPNLMVPFALVGAAAGWLSSGLGQVVQPYPMDLEFRGLSAGAAAVIGAATGALLRRWCVGRRYGWELDTPDPDARPPSDSWARHVIAILCAGALTGAIVAVGWDDPEAAGLLALAGLACAVPFLPICAAVLSAARRAQRARLGSIVAGSDRRAVWAILATALLFATIEAVPDWHLRGAHGPVERFVATGLIGASVLCVVAVLAADVAARRRAAKVIVPGLTRREGEDIGADEQGAARVDLGLGNDVHAQVQRGAAAYRSRERAVALVQGDPAQMFAALRRALVRGALSVGVAAAVIAVHVAASSSFVFGRYQLWRCERGDFTSCADGATAAIEAGGVDPRAAVLMLEKGCAGGHGESCMSLAGMYRGEKGIDRDAALVAFFEYHAAQQGLCPEGTRLVRGTERVCVEPGDPRQ